MPKFHGENFRGCNGSQTAKFVKVFSLESFPLYSLVPRPQPRTRGKALGTLALILGSASSAIMWLFALVCIGARAVTWWCARLRKCFNVPRPFPSWEWGLGTRLPAIRYQQSKPWPSLSWVDWRATTVEGFGGELQTLATLEIKVYLRKQHPFPFPSLHLSRYNTHKPCTQCESKINS
jgi:hypothetical protein